MNYSDLPAVGSALESATFAGIIIDKGTHCAVVSLPGAAMALTWHEAMNWAAEQGGELPSRPVAAMLFANLKDKLNPAWHWTSDEYSTSYAWLCDFGTGGQYGYLKSFEGGAVAVRMIPLEK